ncbi:nuclease [Sporosarcina sp. NCCP-2222]|uniref:nuclease-related domain-containing protein n=1 Tax=Sporosarcina sp. NCCP-2222 TaxID=2935073 RepID=UPI00207E82D9|nr:nuclease-related domain-containing protein [Sporosarcina sp. NCCP-2222]GKV54930.1 nuclease [Sporosarcina sp. NCCP-2222]
MIYKKRKEPATLQALRKLLRRLPETHEKYGYVSEDFRRRAAGFSGESYFDKHINEFRPSYPYVILHDVCLKQNGIYFQMDSLLITPTGIFIFEVKNLAGKIIVKSDPTQFIQENLNERKVLQNPILELERKEIFLKQWLLERGIDLPIIGIVVLAYTNEIIMNEQPAKQVVSTQDVPILLYSQRLEQEIITSQQIREIASVMIVEHQEYVPEPLLQMFGIPLIDILPGVICPNCFHFGMKRLLRRWSCSNCGCTSTDAHLELIEDWLVLVERKLTNQQFREFACIQDIHVAKRLLQNSGLTMYGVSKDAYYYRN